ncbi:MAG: hypothetical protein J6P74_03155 [Paludibacteraceae bacterium]|nr:hypothetical protein [Paludibacteraceae bacterium]
MKKLFLLSALVIAATFVWATPTITIDGDKSDWAEVPMLSEPGTWPMLKVLPAADASMGTNALAYMVENTTDFDNTWAAYPTEIIDKDYNPSTKIGALDVWQYSAMGAEYKATTGVSMNDKWVSFPKGISADNKVIELGIPASYVTDLESKFGFAMYYNSGAWYCPQYNSSTYPEISSKNGFLYKSRSFTTLPGTVTAANAFAHQSMGECTSYVDFGLRDNGYDTLRWAAFPVTLETPAMYDVTVNISSTNDWKFEFWLVDIASNIVVAHLNRAGGSSSDVTKKLGTLDLTAVPAGKYMLKVQNKTAYSKVKLNSIDITYAGGAVINIPATLQPIDAIRSEYAQLDQTGVVDTLTFAPKDKEWMAIDETYSVAGSQYVKWNIKIAKAGKYKFTANTFCKQGHNYRIILLNEDESSTIYTKQEKEGTGSDYHNEGADWQVATDVIDLSAGNYVLKMQGKSYGRVMSVIASYEGGATTVIPGLLKAEDAVLVPKKMYHAANGDIQYDDYGTVPTDEYAYWRITTTGACSGKVTLNIPIESGDKGHQFHVELYSALDGDKLSEAYETSTKYNNGIVELSQTFEISSAGSYFIKLVNATKYSSAILRGIYIAPVITLDEEATNVATVIEPNDGKTVNVQLTRSLVSGMYNTICLPFAVSAAEKTRVFGDAEVKKLTSSSIEDGGFVLNLNFDAVDEMEAGVPYIIKPTEDISNPKFLGVTINNTLNNTETSNAEFIGNFVKSTIEASEDNLFLGANNTLYFPTIDMEIKGMRAYFEVNNPSGAPIRRARIVEQGNVVTEIEIAQPDMLDKVDKSNVTKRIENGQLLIIRESVQYNALGVRVK